MIMRCPHKKKEKVKSNKNEGNEKASKMKERKNELKKNN